MNRKTIIACSLLVLALSVIVLMKSYAQPASAEQEIRDFEKRANAAYEANDLAKYFSFYADDFTQYLPEGRTDLPAYKKEWTDYIGQGNRVEKVELSDMQVQIGPSGDSAVASYILHVRTKLKDGKITEEDNQESDVLFKRNGQWKVVFLHYSAAPKQDAH
ncbi:MAG: nuclear transport factor 2 family protein [Acidobacteria bacterium]|nr:nuclear transport factor 2 family protein [Acidobacteriota bacterium]MBS1865317.1 nuclear transport factor 2 family protein [Acidobacteriota bacterium]